MNNPGGQICISSDAYTGYAIHYTEYNSKGSELKDETTMGWIEKKEKTSTIDFWIPIDLLFVQSWGYKIKCEY